MLPWPGSRPRSGTHLPVQMHPSIPTRSQHKQSAEPDWLFVVRKGEACSIDGNARTNDVASGKRPVQHKLYRTETLVMRVLP